jgi:Tn3 transposase DDE domain
MYDLYDLQGFTLTSCIRDLMDQRLYLVESMSEHEALKKLFHGQAIHRDLIVHYWADMHCISESL